MQGIPHGHLRKIFPGGRKDKSEQKKHLKAGRSASRAGNQVTLSPVFLSLYPPFSPHMKLSYGEARGQGNRRQSRRVREDIRRLPEGETKVGVRDRTVHPEVHHVALKPYKLAKIFRPRAISYRGPPFRATAKGPQKTSRLGSASGYTNFPGALLKRVYKSLGLHGTLPGVVHFRVNCSKRTLEVNKVIRLRKLESHLISRTSVAQRAPDDCALNTLRYAQRLCSLMIILTLIL